jgi:hypothetical protein
VSKRFKDKINSNYMNKCFSIQSKYFSLYQAFREEAEKVGWVYNHGINLFEVEKMEYSNCLFFHTHWRHEGREPMFSFSNSETNVFRLPEQWSEAVEHMKKVFNHESPKEKLSISLKNLADHHGVDVDDIVITA